MILIISNKWDIAVDFVVLELRRRGHKFTRLNAEDLPTLRATIAFPKAAISIDGFRSNLALDRDVKVVWNRRPGYPFDDYLVSEKPSSAVQKFVSDQWHIWRDALTIVPNITWINDPQAEWRAENKVRQLMWAQTIGFAVPKTLVTNDPAAIREFQSSCDGKIIAKALYAPLIEEPEFDTFIFTNALPVLSPDDDPSIRLCPMIVQELIAEKTEYRVTVIGGRLLIARIVSDTGIPVDLDWRTQKQGLRFVACNIPQSIEEMCISYVKQCGLLFGAIDLVESHGQFYFLEINPNGEWGWLQKQAGLPIAEHLCDLFIASDK